MIIYTWSDLKDFNPIKPQEWYWQVQFKIHTRSKTLIVNWSQIKYTGLTVWLLEIFMFGSSWSTLRVWNQLIWIFVSKYWKVLYTWLISELLIWVDWKYWEYQLECFRYTPDNRLVIQFNGDFEFNFCLLFMRHMAAFRQL